LTRSLPILVAAFAVASCGKPASNSPAENVRELPPAQAPQPATMEEPASAAPARQSTFTKLDAGSCGPERTIAETGDWDRTCKGAGLYTLEWNSGDLREDLAVIDGDRRSALAIPVKVANGAFDSIGDTVEWRGAPGRDPDVMIVRVKVANDQGEDDAGSLAVARLGSTPCIVAVVPPSAGQSDRARAIADGKLPGCRAD
jgi:hypothetical protein